MCYLYDTLHELFEAKDLNMDLFKEFYNKYSDNENIIDYVMCAIEVRGWMNLEVYKLHKKDDTITSYNYYPFKNCVEYINDIIKNDNIDMFMPTFDNIRCDLINEVFRMVFYHDAIKCLKYILLQNDKNYIHEYINDCVPKCIDIYKNIVENNQYDVRGFVASHHKFKHISSHADIIKTIRTVIGFNTKFENLLLIDALYGLNFNVIKNVENEFRTHNIGDKFDMLKYNYLDSMDSSILQEYIITTYMLYKDFTKRDIYIICNRNRDTYVSLKEYFDYLCEVTFDKDYDKELMEIVICEQFDNYQSDFNDLCDFFKPYNEVYAAGLHGLSNIDLKNNRIYNMLSKNSRDIIDVFIAFNEIYTSKTYTDMVRFNKDYNDAYSGTLSYFLHTYNKKYNIAYNNSREYFLNMYNNNKKIITEIESKLNSIMKVLNDMMCKYIEESYFMENDFDIYKYIELYNSAFSEIL